MKNIADLKVTATMVFKQDFIPFGSLLTASNLKSLTTPYSFKDLNFEEDENKNIISVVMRTGEFLLEKKIHPIDIFSIEHNRIYARMQANSEITNKFFQSIGKQLSEIDINNDFKIDKSLFTLSETSCVVTLDFDYHKIFSKGFNDFISTEVKKKCSSITDKNIMIDITPKQLVMDVNYTLKEKSGKNISLGSKQLRIEPRWGVDIKERRFFTVSPCDSVIHFKLLSALESKMRDRK